LRRYCGSSEHQPVRRFNEFTAWQRKRAARDTGTLPRSNPVNAILVFLHLLKCDADRAAKMTFGAVEHL